MKIKDNMCLNGCNKPVCPPSKVVCRDCLDKMEETLKKLAGGWVHERSS